MIRLVLITLTALALVAQSPAKPPASVEDAAIQRFRAHARPRPVAPAAPLSAEEKNIIRRFKEVKPSVVFVSALLKNRDPKTHDITKISTGSGTGFVWDEWGHIVTNHHVISVEQGGKLLTDVDEVEVTFSNGKTYKGRVIGTSYAYDIAVIQAFAPAEIMHPIPIGRSLTLQVGQSVLAIGNPYGLDHSLTTGVISALGREIATGYSTWILNSIQTDAAINPGNSGGPLLDSGGRLIGMNTAIVATRGEGSVGVGFALPVDTLNQVVPKLIAKGRIEPPRMGFQVLSAYDAQQIGYARGLVVSEVEANSPAQRAGLRPLTRDASGRYVLGDILLSYQGEPLESAGQFMAMLEYLAVVGLSKDEVVFDVLRDGKIIQVTLELKKPRAPEEKRLPASSI
ncbi:MAG: trypsin-like peptidase domain-containing protein [Geothrix sp.]|nr:trypsin-like peptidase domain-containing protein [Geothrix sp.]